MYIYIYICFSFVGLRTLPPAPLIAKCLSGYGVLSLCGEVSRSLGRSVARSIARPLGRSGVMPLGRSIGRSIGRSTGQ